MKIVEIEWVDSNHNTGWTNVEAAAEFANTKLSLTCKTTGYLLSETKDRISIVQSLSWRQDDEPPESVDAIMTIPKRAVIKRRYLK